ncbi:unnamed protein product, partial [Notodromas monacha]
MKPRDDFSRMIFISAVLSLGIVVQVAVGYPVSVMEPSDSGIRNCANLWTSLLATEDDTIVERQLKFEFPVDADDWFVQLTFDSPILEVELDKDDGSGLAYRYNYNPDKRSVFVSPDRCCNTVARGERFHAVIRWPGTGNTGPTEQSIVIVEASLNIAAGAKFLKYDLCQSELIPEASNDGFAAIADEIVAANDEKIHQIGDEIEMSPSAITTGQLGTIRNEASKLNLYPPEVHQDELPLNEGELSVAQSGRSSNSGASGNVEPSFIANHEHDQVDTNKNGSTAEEAGMKQEEISEEMVSDAGKLETDAFKPKPPSRTVGKNTESSSIVENEQPIDHGFEHPESFQEGGYDGSHQVHDQQQRESEDQKSHDGEKSETLSQEENSKQQQPLMHLMHLPHDSSQMSPDLKDHLASIDTEVKPSAIPSSKNPLIPRQTSGQTRPFFDDSDVAVNDEPPRTFSDDIPGTRPFFDDSDVAVNDEPPRTFSDDIPGVSVDREHGSGLIDGDQEPFVVYGEQDRNPEDVVYGEQDRNPEDDDQIKNVSSSLTSNQREPSSSSISSKANSANKKPGSSPPPFAVDESGDTIPSTVDEEKQMIQASNVKSKPENPGGKNQNTDASTSTHFHDFENGGQIHVAGVQPKPGNHFNAKGDKIKPGSNASKPSSSNVGQDSQKVQKEPAETLKNSSSFPAEEEEDGTHALEPTGMKTDDFKGSSSQTESGFKPMKVNNGERPSGDQEPFVVYGEQDRNPEDDDQIKNVSSSLTSNQREPSSSSISSKANSANKKPGSSPRPFAVDESGDTIPSTVDEEKQMIQASNVKSDKIKPGSNASKPSSSNVGQDSQKVQKEPAETLKNSSSFPAEEEEDGTHALEPTGMKTDDFKGSPSQTESGFKPMKVNSGERPSGDFKQTHVNQRPNASSNIHHHHDAELDPVIAKKPTINVSLNDASENSGQFQENPERNPSQASVDVSTAFRPSRPPVVPSRPDAIDTMVSKKNASKVSQMSQETETGFSAENPFGHLCYELRRLDLQGLLLRSFLLLSHVVSHLNRSELLSALLVHIKPHHHQDEEVASAAGVEGFLEEDTKMIKGSKNGSGPHQETTTAVVEDMLLEEAEVLNEKNESKPNGSKPRPIGDAPLKPHFEGMSNQTVNTAHPPLGGSHQTHQQAHGHPDDYRDDVYDHRDDPQQPHEYPDTDNTHLEAIPSPILLPGSSEDET